LNDIQIFLETIYERKPRDLYLLLWEKLEKQKLSYWFQDVAEATRFATAHEVNIYSGVNLSGKDYGPHARCKAADIAAQCAFIADIDVAGPAHKNKALPPTYDDARLVMPPELKPTLLVDSGNGLQGWWALKEPVVFADNDQRKRSQGLAIRWHRTMEARSEAKGWKLDAVFDLPRVLRIAGSINRKDSGDKLSRILEITDARYTLADFEEYLRYAMPPESEAAVKREARRILPPEVGPLIATPEATIDPAIYAALSENSPIFCATWRRERLDLAGNSQSEWDLALANILWDAGLSDQQMADAILHYRRLHNARKKDDPDDYIRRTMLKARTRLRQTKPDSALSEALTAPVLLLPTIEEIEDVPRRSPASIADEPESQAEVMGDEGSPEEEEKRAEHLATLNVALGHQINDTPNPIDRIVWIPGKKEDATWRIELHDGQIVTLNDASQFMDYASLKRKFAGQVNGILKAEIKKGYWSGSGAALFQKCAIKESTGEQHDVRGDITDLLERYLLTQTPIPANAIWTDPNNLHVPAVYHGQLAIHAEGMTQYMNRSQGERLEVRQIRSGLSAIAKNPKGNAKGNATKINGPRGRSQSRYLLPADKWDAEEYVDAANERRVTKFGRQGEPNTGGN
jgi:hypothetical protein